MSFNRSVLLLLLLAHVATYAHSQRVSRTVCGTRCRFALCSRNQINFFGAPNTGTFPTICRRNENIGQILRVGESFVQLPGGNVRISQWRPEGLTPNFPRKFFFPTRIPGEENSGLAKRRSRGTQHGFTQERCFELPILEYERIVNGTVVRKMAGKRQDCLAFFSRVPDIVVEAQWKSGDDFDLEVTEPGGALVSNAGRTTCGKLTNDNNVDTCDFRKVGNERIQFDKSCNAFNNGKYVARLRHGRNCGDGPSMWELRIVVDGALVKKTSGSSNDNNGRVVTELSFDI